MGFIITEKFFVFFFILPNNKDRQLLKIQKTFFAIDFTNALNSRGRKKLSALDLFFFSLLVSLAANFMSENMCMCVCVCMCLAIFTESSFT